MWRLCQILAVVVLVVVGGWTVKRFGPQLILEATIGTPTTEQMYPKAHELPPRSDTPITELLSKLERVLGEKCPNVLAAMNPGLPAEEIVRLERESGITLSEEFKELYAWHNGCKNVADQFVPGHTFLPFESVIVHKQTLATDARNMTDAQKDVHQMYTAFSDHWLPIFQDVAGDGYFFDPTRTYEEGALFYCCLEMGDYVFYSALENLLACFVECYNTGVYTTDAQGKELFCDFEKAAAVANRYGRRAPFHH